MWYQSFRYIFNRSDINYIDALTRLYPDMPIESFSVSGEKLSFQNRKLAELKTMLNEIQVNPDKNFTDKGEISIITPRYPANATTYNVFPEFQPQMEYIIDSKNDREKFKVDLDLISNFLLNTQYIVRKPDILPHVTTKEDAWKILNLLHEKLPFLSALDLPSLNGILLLTANNAYFVSYNQKQNQINDTIYPAFDIDEGFVPSPYGSIIAKEMQEAFKLWKKNDYQGPIVFSHLNNNLVLKDSTKVSTTRLLKGLNISDDHKSDKSLSIVKVEENKVKTGPENTRDSLAQAKNELSNNIADSVKEETINSRYRL